MFEQIVNLITRGVVALETIAANYQPAGAAVNPKDNGTAKSGKKAPAKEEVEDQDDEELEDEPKTKGKKAPAKTSKGKKAPVEDEDDGEEEEEAPKSKKAPAKGKGKGKDPLRELRDEIAQYAGIISGGDDDDASDEFSDLLEDFEVKTVGKLDDEDVEEFHGLIKAIVEEYFEVE